MTTSNNALVVRSEAQHEVLSRRSRERRRAIVAKRDNYFLKGPLVFAWIRENIPDATSRVVLIAKAFLDMGAASEVVLSAKIWDCAGVRNRYQRRRILARLRALGGELEVLDRPGRPSMLRKR
jgi:hypothetical protein